MPKNAKPAAVLGALVNMKNVATHKSVALTIHVPAEAAQEVLAAFGWPTMVDPVPVAVARLEATASQYGACQEPQSAEVQRPDLTGAPPGPRTAESEEVNQGLASSIQAQLRHLKAMDEAMAAEPPAPTRLRHWAEMTPAQQTGVIRNEPDFWEYAGVLCRDNRPDAARDFIRAICRVDSCAEIRPGTEAAALWAQLQVSYGNWLRAKRGAA